MADCAGSEPDKYADIPEADIPTPLSDRWQRCAWQQACGIVRSWYSNERTNPPVLKTFCLQGNANVIKLEPATTPTFDFWLKISTLDRGQPIEVPLRLYRRAKETLQKYPKLCTGVTLNKREGQWYATLVVENLPPGSPVALERLQVQDMRFKSRRMNRRLRASQLGYIRDKLKFKLDEQGIRYRSVQPAYSSQECSRCGFVHEKNRRSQAEFQCANCGYIENADVNAARNIAKRFGDDELNGLPFRDVKTVLEARFRRQLSPDARSASAGRDTLRKGNAECPQQSIRPV